VGRITLVRPAQLTGSYAKLDRAREHVRSLADAQVDYFGTDQRTRPFDVDHHFDPGTNLYSFIGRVTREPPPRIGTIIGDIAHNLRSALDYLVWELVLAHAGDPEQLGKPLPEFPICMTTETWERVLRTRIRNVSPQAAARLRDFQPFATDSVQLAEAPLRRLDLLCNHDKHRSITVATAAIRAVHDGITYVRSPASADVRLVPVRDVAEIHDAQSFWGVPLDGHPVVQARITPSGPEPRVELQGSSIAGLAFTDRSSVDYGIARMAVAVEDVVDAFAEER
jgi:hypothetical protein